MNEAIGYQLSAIGKYAIGYRLSAISQKKKAINHRLSAMRKNSGRQPTADSRQPSSIRKNSGQRPTADSRQPQAIRKNSGRKPKAESQQPLPRGISLLEVLISMFVLAVGLLGLASMVPVGQFQVQQANNADAAVATGRSFAFRQIKIKDMLDSGTWVNSSAAAYTPTAPNPFMIDGIGVTGYSYSAFPYSAFPAGPGVPARLDRISLQDPTTSTAIDAETADRIFRNVDDKNFQVLPDETQRPILTNSAGPTQGQSRGDFSWIMMVQPAVWWNLTPLANSPPGLATPQFINGLGTTTVIVYHKRDPTNNGTPPSERSFYADLQGVGANNLDIRLRPAALPASLNAAKNLMRLRPNQWVMISAQIAAVRVPSSGTPVTVNTPAINVHCWFRVVMAGEVEVLDPTSAVSAANPYVCDVTLAGPDLNYFVPPANNVSRYADGDGSNATGIQDANGVGMTFVCTICDGVVGIFEKTVQLDEPSLWTAH